MGNSALPVGSSRALALKLAADLARQVGMVRTWPNLQTIRLAIESEAEQSEVSASEATEIIGRAAREITIVDAQMYSYQAAAILRKSNNVNRFWFEDALWRHKECYQWWSAETEGNRRAAETPKTPRCFNCNDRGYVFNYGPGKRTQPCPNCQLEASA